MNILVTGANGQLGNAMRIASRNSDDNYIFTDIMELDITDRNAVMNVVKNNDIKVIVNCAAYTNVEKAEEEADLAEILNATAVRNLADAVKSNDATLIHISTDYVFGGLACNTPLTESAQVNPTCVYGLSKLHGEQAIAESGANAIILRTAWLYSEYGKNFVKTMLDLTSTKPHIKVVFDQCGTPTYAGDLANVISMIIENRLFKDNEGIYHFSNEGICSWFDLSKTIASIAGNNNCDIEPCHSDEFPSNVTRPAYSVLDKTKIKNTFGINVPYWVDSLKKCIKNLNKNDA